MPLAIQAWEGMQEEHKRQYCVDPINDITKWQILRRILPEDVQKSLETQTMLRDDLTYDQIKLCCNNLAQQMGNPLVPMEISPFDPEGETVDFRPCASWRTEAWQGDRPSREEQQQ